MRGCRGGNTVAGRGHCPSGNPRPGASHGPGDRVKPRDLSRHRAPQAMQLTMFFCASRLPSIGVIHRQPAVPAFPAQSLASCAQIGTRWPGNAHHRAPPRSFMQAPPRSDPLPAHPPLRRASAPGGQPHLGDAVADSPPPKPRSRGPRRLRLRCFLAAFQDRLSRCGDHLVACTKSVRAAARLRATALPKRQGMARRGVAHDAALSLALILRIAGRSDSSRHVWR